MSVKTASAQRITDRFLEAAEKSAASEIDIHDIGIEQQDLVLFLERSYGMKPDTAWEGIHGTIVDFKTPDPNRARFTDAGLKKLMAFPTFRWLSLGRNPSIGM